MLKWEIWIPLLALLWQIFGKSSEKFYHNFNVDIEIIAFCFAQNIVEVFIETDCDNFVDHFKHIGCGYNKNNENVYNFTGVIMSTPVHISYEKVSRIPHESEDLNKSLPNLVKKNY